jgi:RimJ/RimL family protein N-acetyltransferase
MQTIRPLLSSDAVIFQSLRLRGLTECPAAFSSSLEEEADTPLSVTEARLAPKPGSAVLGCFQDEKLVGVLGVLREPQRKLAHKALLWGMYVAPEYRRNGVGRSLVSSALQYAVKELGVQVVNLGVNTANTAAIALYERLGFRTWGTERGYMSVDGVLQDEHYMGCNLPLV